MEFQQQKRWVRAWRGECTGSLLPLSYRLLDVCAAKCAKMVAMTAGQERLDAESEPLEDIVLWTFGVNSDASSASQISISVRFSLSERLAQADFVVSGAHTSLGAV